MRVLTPSRGGVQSPVQLQSDCTSRLCPLSARPGALCPELDESPAIPPPEGLLQSVGAAAAGGVGRAPTSSRPCSVGSTGAARAWPWRPCSAGSGTTNDVSNSSLHSLLGNSVGRAAATVLAAAPWYVLAWSCASCWLLPLPLRLCRGHPVLQPVEAQTGLLTLLPLPMPQLTAPKSHRQIESSDAMDAHGGVPAGRRRHRGDYRRATLVGHGWLSKLFDIFP